MPNTLHPPPDFIQSWPEPNYSNPDSRGPGLLVLSISLVIVGGLLISIRTYTRLRITRAFGLDDALVIIAYFLSITLSILVIIGNIFYYSGRHIWDVPPSTFVAHRHNIWWSELLYVSASCTVKISVLLFYRRLSISFTKRFFWAVWIGLGANILYFVVFLGLLFAICNPLEAYWNSFDPEWVRNHPNFSCHPEQISLPLSAAFSVLTDLYATLVPLILVCSISKSLREKIGLYLIFSAGFLVVVCGILRTVYSYRVLNVNYDFTWELYDCWIYTQLELNLAILAACAPTLRPVANRCFQAFKRRGQRCPVFKICKTTPSGSSSVGKNDDCAGTCV